MSVLYIILAISFSLFYYHFYKDLFTPHIIFLSSWLLTCSFSCIDFGTYMRPWCEEMYLVTLVSAFSYWLGTLAFLPSKPILKRMYVSRTTLSSSFDAFLTLIFIVCILCFGIEWYLGGMQSLFTVDFSSDVKSQLSESAIPGVHYGTLLLPFVALYAIYASFNSDGIFSDIIVPENTVFALGDNRNSSVDCRVFGCIPLEKIEGTVAIRFWPINEFGKVEN